MWASDSLEKTLAYCDRSVFGSNHGMIQKERKTYLINLADSRPTAIEPQIASYGRKNYLQKVPKRTKTQLVSKKIQISDFYQNLMKPDRHHHLAQAHANS